MICDDVKKRLIAAVTAWSLRGMDHIAAKGIIMRSRYFSDLAVGLWKSVEPGQPAAIVTLDISSLCLPPSDAYAISYQAGSWVDVKWVEM